MRQQFPQRLIKGSIVMFILSIQGSSLPVQEFNDEDEAITAFNHTRLMNPFVRIDLLEMIYYEAYQVIKTTEVPVKRFKNPYI